MLQIRKHLHTDKFRKHSDKNDCTGDQATVASIKGQPWGKSNADADGIKDETKIRVIEPKDIVIYWRGVELGRLCWKY